MIRRNSFVLTAAASLLVMMATGLLACGSSSDLRQETILELEGDATSGRVLYEENCAGCHGDDGQSGSVGENILGASSSSIVLVVLTGKDEMPSFADDLSDQEIADIAAYVDTL